MRLQTPAKLVGGLALLLGCVLSARAQGTFENLNFESATIVLDPSSPFYPYAANAADALPGWTVLGGVPEGDVLYGTKSLGAAVVAIIDANYPAVGTPLQGLYSVGLSGQFLGSPPFQSMAIAQTGQLPSAAQSLTFFAQLGSLQITFNGQVLPYTAIGTGPDYRIYGCDISAFAGQTGELRFTTLPNTSALIDNIQFSDQPVPEPGVFGLSALGALLFGWRAVRRR